jgi:uncharacterized protein YdhG (YjbR/CyaY superfamily)
MTVSKKKPQTSKTAKAAGDEKKRIAAQLKTYMAALPPDGRRALKQLRELILELAPAAEPAFSYGIPGFRLDGRVLIWCAAWRHHTSLYPMSPALRAANAAALAKYEQSKGTVRFPLAEPLPLPLVKRLVRGRVAEVRALNAARG